MNDMPDIGFLSPDDLRRLVLAVRRFEQQANGPKTPAAPAYNEQFVVPRTNVPAGVGSGSGMACPTGSNLWAPQGSDDYYDGYVVARAEPAGKWISMGDVWLLEANDADVTAGKRYFARQVGTRCIGQDTRPVFVIVPGGSTVAGGVGSGSGQHTGPCPTFDIVAKGCFDGGGQPAQPCGCTPDIADGGKYPGFCWPTWNGVNLQCTGVSIHCLLDCYNNQMVARRACLAVVPGGPFGFRLALISIDDGSELTTTSG